MKSRPPLSECIEVADALTSSVRLTEREQLMLFEVVEAARWWLRDQLGAPAANALLRPKRRASYRRRWRKAARFNRLFK